MLIYLYGKLGTQYEKAIFKVIQSKILEINVASMN